MVTGTNALYEEVLKRVEQLDQADLSIPKKFEIIPDAGDLALQIQTLRAMFGDKIVEIDSDTGEAVDGSKAAPASRPSSTPASSSSQAEAQRQAFIKAIQQRAQQSGGSPRGGAPTSGGRGGGSGRGGR